MNYWLLLIPVISAFIGWFINSIAVKLLFHPHNPVNILGYTVQGVFPKRQEQFAEQAGKLLAKELFSFSDIEQKIINPENLKKVLPQLEIHIDHFLRVKLGKSMPMIGMFIGDKTIDKLKAVFLEELETLFPKMMQEYVATLKNQLNLEEIVSEKIKNFPIDQLEAAVSHGMAKELRFVKILGAVTGFFIGLLQLIITLLTQ